PGRVPASTRRGRRTFASVLLRLPFSRRAAQMVWPRSGCQHSPHRRVWPAGLALGWRKNLALRAADQAVFFSASWLVRRLIARCESLSEMKVINSINISLLESLIGFHCRGREALVAFC